MRKLLLYIAVFIALMAGTGCSIVDNIRSSRLHNEAVNAFGKGEDAREFNYSEALPFYEEALEKLEKVKNKYPSSPTAVKIENDEAVLGYYTYDRLKNVYLPEWRERARAESDIFNCSIFMSEENAGRIVDIAGKYTGIDNVKVSAALDIALESAEVIQEQYQKGTTLENIMNAYFKIGDFDKALNVAGLIPEDGWSKAAVLFAQAGQFETCEYLIGKIDDKRKKFFAYRTYGESAVEKEDAGHAAKAADMAIDLAGLLEDDTSRDSGFGSVAVLYAEAGSFDKALDAAERITDPIGKCQTLNSISLCYIGQGRGAEGARLLDRSHGMAKAIGDKGRGAMLGEEIASAYIKAKEYKKALDIITEDFNDTEHIELYEYITFNYSLLGDVILESGNDGQEDLSDRAFRKLLDLPGDTKDWNLLSYIVIPLVKNGSSEKAEKASDLIRDNGTKARAYIEIAGGYVEEARKELAEKAVRKAYEYASGVEADPNNIPELLRSIASIYLDLGCKDEAEEVLDTAVRQAAGIEPGDTRARIMEASALLYCRMGLHEKGMKTVDLSNTEEWERDNILEGISKYYAEEGEINRAMETIGLMGLPHCRGRAYTQIAKEYLESQQRDKASEMLAKAFEEVSLSVDVEKEYFNEIPELFDIAEVYCEMLQKDKAASVMAKALEAVELIRDRNSAGGFLADIDVKYTQTGIQMGEKEKEILHRIVEHISI